MCRSWEKKEPEQQLSPLGSGDQSFHYYISAVLCQKMAHHFYHFKLLTTEDSSTELFHSPHLPCLLLLTVIPGILGTVVILFWSDLLSCSFNFVTNEGHSSTTTFFHCGMSWEGGTTAQEERRVKQWCDANILTRGSHKNSPPSLVCVPGVHVLQRDWGMYSSAFLFQQKYFLITTALERDSTTWQINFY